MATATGMGCHHEVAAIFQKYDRALLRCTNEEEARHIGQAGAIELHRLMGVRGNLVDFGAPGRVVEGGATELFPAEAGFEASGNILKL